MAATASGRALLPCIGGNELVIDSDGLMVSPSIVCTVSASSFPSSF